MSVAPEEYQHAQPAEPQNARPTELEDAREETFQHLRSDVTEEACAEIPRTTPRMVVHTPSTSRRKPRRRRPMSFHSPTLTRPTSRRSPEVTSRQRRPRICSQPSRALSRGTSMRRSASGAPDDAPDYKGTQPDHALTARIRVL